MVNYRGAISEEQLIDKPKPMTHPEIARDLQDRIERGEYPVGTPIPSYRKIAELYGVSESTAGKAVSLLRERGYIEKWEGRANIVRPRPTPGEDHRGKP